MPETRLVAKLKATAAVTAICGTRMFPLELPQKVTYPAIAYQQVGEDSVGSSTTEADVAFTRIQVTSYAEMYSAAKALNEAVRTALNGWTDAGGTPAVSGCSRAGTYDIPGAAEPGQDKYLYGVAGDFIVQHASAS